MADRISVLIIESEPNLRGKPASALTEAGFVVGSAPDYHEALVALELLKPDIAIVDEALPSGDGKLACSELRTGFDIRVILLGGGSGDKARMRVVEVEADFYFEKPRDYRETVATVEDIVQCCRGMEMKEGH